MNIHGMFERLAVAVKRNNDLIEKISFCDDENLLLYFSQFSHHIVPDRRHGLSFLASAQLWIVP